MSLQMTQFCSFLWLSNIPLYKYIRTDAEAEALISWPPDVKNCLIGKGSDAGKDWRHEEKGMTEGEMVGWHHRLNGHEFEQAPGVGDRQGSLACCLSMGSQRVRPDWETKLNWWIYHIFCIHSSVDGHLHCSLVLAIVLIYVIKHRKLSLLLCGDLDGRDGGPEGRNICICKADSVHCTAETNTIL